MLIAGTTAKPIELESSRLIVARRRRGMSHEELAEATGIPAGTLRDWESQEAWCNSQEAIDKLAWALKFPPGFFTADEIETLEHWQVNFCHIEYDAVIICAGGWWVCPVAHGHQKPDVGTS